MNMYVWSGGLCASVCVCVYGVVYVYVGTALCVCDSALNECNSDCV